MNGLILSKHELLQCVDLGYKDQEDDELRFPVRLSALGHCPRKTRALLSGAAKREFSARSLRIFEQGHDRGARLAHVLHAGLGVHLLNLAHGDWKQLTEEELHAAVAELGERYQVHTEVEVWCPTQITGERAEQVVAAALKWQEDNDIHEPEKLSVMVNAEGVLCIRGRADVVIVDKVLRQFWVLDFKTKNSWGFKKLKDEGNSEDYEVQVLAYVRGFIHEQEEPWTCEGAWLYYEDHDKRNHEVVPVLLEDDGILDLAIDRTSKLLRNWATGGSIEEAPAIHAQPSKWTKKKHVGAAGCLPWQCNYCSVGPVIGGCVDTDLFRLEDIQGPNDEIPKWEVTSTT